MASPQRRDPRQPRELEDMQHRDVQKEIGPGWRGGYWWIWILIFVGIWWVAFGWGNSGGYVWGGHHRAAEMTNDTALGGPGVPILDASNKTRYIGQAFQVRNVPVQAQAGNQAFWIGSTTNSAPMLVVLPKAGEAADIHNGWFNVAGQVEKAPPAAQAQQQWGLSQQDAQRLESEGAYIQATQAIRALH